MSRKRPDRPERTERRISDRALRQVVRDREKLARLAVGGGADHPIVVSSASVVEGRVEQLPCPQCGGEYRLIEHTAPAAGLRACRVTCRMCGVSRTLWFRIAPPAATEAN